MSIHGRNHRPAGTNGPSDPGGEDQIPGVVIGGDGIQFDITNTGNWLDIRTDDTAPAGAGVTISDTSPGVVGVDINATGQIQIGSDDTVSIGPNLVVASVANELVQLTVPGPSTSGLIIVNITNGSGTKFQILSGGVPILEVRDDDTFHIKTGATWVADL